MRNSLGLKILFLEISVFGTSHALTWITQLNKEVSLFSRWRKLGLLLWQSPSGTTQKQLRCKTVSVTEYDYLLVLLSIIPEASTPALREARWIFGLQTVLCYEIKFKIKLSNRILNKWSKLWKIYGSWSNSGQFKH